MDTITQAGNSPEFLKLLAHDIRWGVLRVLSRSDHQVQDLVRLLNQPYNLVSYHLRRLRDMQIIREHRSTMDAREVYYSLDVIRLRDLFQATGDALHPAMRGDVQAREMAISVAEQTNASNRPRVLFLCTHNSARSQMAEGILRHLAVDNIEVESAGTEVTHVRTEAMETMAALGIDISGQHSKNLNEFVGQHWDYVVTVCDRAKESCPTFPDDPELIHWSFDDPSAVKQEGARLVAYQKTARELMMRIRLLLGLIERDTRRKV